MRRGGVDRLGQRAERNAAPLELVDDPEEVRGRAPEPVELPDHEHVARPQIGKAGLQPGPVVARARGLVVRWRSSPPAAISASRCRSTDWRSSAEDTRM